MEFYENLRRAGENDGRPLVLRQREGQRIVLTLGDPGRLNPLSAGLTLQLQQHLNELSVRSTYDPRRARLKNSFSAEVSK